MRFVALAIMLLLPSISQSSTISGPVKNQHTFFHVSEPIPASIMKNAVFLKALAMRPAMADANLSAFGASQWNITTTGISARGVHPQISAFAMTNQPAGLYRRNIARAAVGFMPGRPVRSVDLPQTIFAYLAAIAIMTQFLKRKTSVATRRSYFRIIYSFKRNRQELAC